MEQQDKIILIGAGNVAHHLAGALLKRERIYVRFIVVRLILPGNWE